METRELYPLDGRKSFYGKAAAVEIDGEIYCKSYDTLVCKVNRDGEFIRLWGGYSQTTMRHVNSFCYEVGIPYRGKKWWDSLPCGEATAELRRAYALTA